MVDIKILRRKRRELDLTQEQLASMCSISRAHINNIEKGRVVPSLHILRIIALALGFDSLKEVVV